MARDFDNQQYMQGKILGFMYLDNGQELIAGLLSYAIKKKDKKISYYQEHAHALASSFMHLDNGQELIAGLLSYAIKKKTRKYHTIENMPTLSPAVAIRVKSWQNY